jgi:CheY-like chemotaxis protein
VAKNLLVVENNPFEREGLAAVLRQEGYGVVCAANGREALERLKDQPTPDLMLLDMMMSEIDGWQLLRMLRGSPRLPTIPVVIVTGLEIATPEWAQSLGAVGLACKPIDVEQLKATLTRVTQRAGLC